MLLRHELSREPNEKDCKRYITRRLTSRFTDSKPDIFYKWFAQFFVPVARIYTLIKHSIISMKNRARRNKYAKVSSVWWCIRKSGIGLDVFVDMLQSARFAYARSERDYFATQPSKYWLLFESVIRRLCTLGFSPAVKLLPSCPRYVWVSDFPDSFVDFRPRPVA